MITPAANDRAKQVAQGIIDQDVDVLLPVGGPIYQSAAEAIRAAEPTPSRNQCRERGHVCARRGAVAPGLA